MWKNKFSFQRVFKPESVFMLARQKTDPLSKAEPPKTTAQSRSTENKKNDRSPQSEPRKAVMQLPDTERQRAVVQPPDAEPQKAPVLRPPDARPRRTVVQPPDAEHRKALMQRPPDARPRRAVVQPPDAEPQKAPVLRPPDAGPRRAVVQPPDAEHRKALMQPPPSMVNTIVCLQAEVKITPGVEVGTVKCFCIGRPIIGPCEGTAAGKCRLIISQNIRVQIPLTFAAHAIVAPAGIVCGKPAAGACRI